MSLFFMMYKKKIQRTLMSFSTTKFNVTYQINNGSNHLPHSFSNATCNVIGVQQKVWLITCVLMKMTKKKRT